MEAVIGEAAGKVWQALHTDGPMAKSRICKTTGLSNDLVNQGIGWLAREGKVAAEGEGKRQKVRLKE